MLSRKHRIPPLDFLILSEIKAHKLRDPKFPTLTDSLMSAGAVCAGATPDQYQLCPLQCQLCLWPGPWVEGLSHISPISIFCSCSSLCLEHSSTFVDYNCGSSSRSTSNTRWEVVQSFIASFTKYLLRTYYVLSTVLGTWESINEQNEERCLHGA